MKTPYREKVLFFLPSVASGLLIALSFPTADLFPLAWAGFVPLLCSVWQNDWKSAFKKGFAFGMVYFFGTLYWIYHSINHFGGVSLYSSIAVVLLLCLYLSIFPAAFSVLFSLAYSRTRLPALLAAPVFWVSLEFLRSYAFTGFPWSSMGYSQYRFLPLIQAADITGIYGISFLLLACNGLITDVIVLRRKLSEQPLFPLSYTFTGALVLLVIILSVFGYGFFRLHQERPGQDVSISVIQGNIEQDRKWEPIFQNEVIATYEALSTEALRSRPSLIIWPETAVPFIYENDTEHTARLLNFQRQIETPLLFGSIIMKKRTAESSELANSALLLDREGKKSYSYDKIHLVPFGEYVPLKSILFFLDKLVVGIGDYMPGRQYLLAETDIGRFGTLICYEIIFPGMVRKFYARGGDLLVTITNDAWFGNTAGPYQHFSMAVFRAIENRKPVVRAANTGISGFIDSSGRIISKTDLFVRQALTKIIRTDSAMTFYTKYGDLFSFLCIIISIIICGNIFPRRQ